MKKLILLAAVAAGVAYVVKFKSDQVKSAATKVTHDPRVQSALATASDKAGRADDLAAPPVPEQAVEVAEADPVSAPEFTGFEPPKVDAADIEPSKPRDPLTDPIETLETPEDPAR